MVKPQLNQQFSDTPIWKFPKWVVPLNHQLYCVVVIIKCLRINQPQHKKHVCAILKWAGPPWWIKGGKSPDSSIPQGFFLFLSHVLNTTPFKSHIVLTLTNLWHRFPHQAQTTTILTLLHWHQPFCDFAVTGLWLCSHKLSLQPWFNPFFWLNFAKKTQVSQMIDFLAKSFKKTSLWEAHKGTPWAHVHSK